MLPWQQLFLMIFSLFSLIVSAKGLYESSRKGRAFTDTIFLGWLGIFVWGDAVVFGPFWFLAAFITLLLRDWYLFAVIISVFWVVRSVGEMIYWFNQQFSPLRRNPPEKMRCYGLFKSEAVWFGYQIFWQSVCVAAVISSIYFVHTWLSK
ncbi:hypothetical protein H3C70_05530 [Patescibacteria group bacterium]|nr:hypothetical protein [Patescibacteria group bacterium]